MFCIQLNKMVNHWVLKPLLVGPPVLCAVVLPRETLSVTTTIPPNPQQPNPTSNPPGTHQSSTYNTQCMKTTILSSLDCLSIHTNELRSYGSKLVGRRSPECPEHTFVHSHDLSLEQSSVQLVKAVPRKQHRGHKEMIHVLYKLYR